MPPLEGDEEVKEGKGLKIMTPNKLLTRFPILLAQTKTRNNSFKLKNEISIIVKNMIMKREPKTFCFDFDWP